MSAMSRFVVAMEEWQEANRAYHKCCDECASSPDYFCGNYREAMNRATADMEKAFEEIIEGAVKSALKQLAEGR